MKFNIVLFLLFLIMACAEPKEEFVGLVKPVPNVLEGKSQAEIPIPNKNQEQSTTEVLVESLVVSNINEQIVRGKWYNITVTVEPANATNKNLIYTSSNPSCVKVENNKFYVMPHAEVSEAIITIATTDGSGVKARLLVKTKALVEEVIIPIGNLSLFAGQEYAVVANVYPQDANNEVIWKSTNQQVATITSQGMIRTSAEGQAYIVATSVENPNVYDAIKVGVMAQTDSIVVESEGKRRTLYEIKVGDTLPLNLVSYYKGKQTSSFGAASFKNRFIFWRIPNTSQAEIDEHWVLHAKAPGRLRIRVKFQSYNALLSNSIDVIINQ